MTTTGLVLGGNLRRTEPHRHVIVARVIAGVPLLGLGMAHVLMPEARMAPLVEAAGMPVPTFLAAVAVAAEIVAGVSLLAGVFARVGALMAIGVMLGAVYSHLVIDVWPNGAENEPPMALPVAVILAAGYVLWRGAGRWSVDASPGSPLREEPTSPALQER